MLEEGLDILDEIDTTVAIVGLLRHLAVSTTESAKKPQKTLSGANSSKEKPPL
jgi:hypothetical protein